MGRDSIERRYAGVQTFLQEGCLFLSLCSIAEEFNGRAVDILEAVAVAKENKWILPSNDLTVDGQCKLLQYLTHIEWVRTERDVLRTELDNEYTVEKWYNSRTGFTHFKRRYVDTLVSSNTVKVGKLMEYYVYSH